jgi:CubicO group peptidase (beta-lactamase class C family)
MAEVEGSVANGFEQVRRAFAENVDQGGAGAALAVTVDGELVVDLWGGMADVDRGLAWGRDTSAVIFSGSKGVIATGLLILVDRGALDLDAPVSRYWPEFAVGSNAAITVAEMCAHCAGIPGAPPEIDLSAGTGPRRLAARLAVLDPFSEVGIPSYHALTYGILAGELIYRIDGRSPGAFVAEELAGPMGDLALRLGYGRGDPVATAAATLRPAADFALRGEEDADPRLGWVYQPSLRYDTPHLRHEFPAFGVITTARAMAVLYGALVSSTRLMRAETLERGLQTASLGDDPLTGRLLRFGPTGYELAGTPSFLGPAPDGFGHTGAGGSSHGAWPGLGVGFSFVTADLQVEESDHRARSLLDVLHRVVSAGSAV